MGNFVRASIIILVVAILIFLGMKLVVGSYGVVSAGMEPGMQAGEKLLVNKLAYKFDEPQRGDIVYFSSPNGDPDQLERVIGLPGDIVEVKDGALFLNGHQIVEPYVSSKAPYSIPQFQVPLDHYFILGDNRNDPDDSPTRATVSANNIQGKAWILTWPPLKWGGAGNYNLSSQLATAELKD